MSLYHEAAGFLQTSSEGGSLKARVFRRRDLKSPPSQLYALILESCKWSGILKEVIERAEILKHERKVSGGPPFLALSFPRIFWGWRRGRLENRLVGLREENMANLFVDQSSLQLYHYCWSMIFCWRKGESPYLRAMG